MQLQNYGLPNVDGTRLLVGAGVLLLLLQELLLDLFGVWDLGNRLSGLEALISRLVLVTTALEALNKGSSLIILGLIIFLIILFNVLLFLLAVVGGSGIDREILIVRLVRLFNHSLDLLGLRRALFGGRRDRLLLLGLLVTCGLLLSGGGGGLLVVAQEISSTLARLGLADGLAIGLGGGVDGSLLGLIGTLLLVLLQSGLGGIILGSDGGFGLDLLGLFGRRLADGGGCLIG